MGCPQEPCAAFHRQSELLAPAPAAAERFGPAQGRGSGMGNRVPREAEEDPASCQGTSGDPDPRGTAATSRQLREPGQAGCQGSKTPVSEQEQG